MSVTAILEDWADYDAYKQVNGRSTTDFLIEDPWEVSYLIDKIKAVYPAMIDTRFMEQAIYSCGRKISVPRHRRLLVQCVMKELGLY